MIGSIMRIAESINNENEKNNCDSEFSDDKDDVFRIREWWKWW
jgi:hypothetical protein